ncbi:hypothetical protein GCM10010970_29990 [Silvimonas iriomotensis]|uniref:Uncharacterized protein n=1 Tax=Silvimonas iriomotensis TaxID=449662 RepID=A0ABQ2PBT7_9NEIS|nr:hypothetical protein GCM10010970_29990 [Silvimonas iriomotensis]
MKIIMAYFEKYAWQAGQGAERITRRARRDPPDQKWKKIRVTSRNNGNKMAPDQSM